MIRREERVAEVMEEVTAHLDPGQVVEEAAVRAVAEVTGKTPDVSARSGA